MTATKLFVVEFDFKEKKIQESFFSKEKEEVILSVQRPAK